MLEVMADTWESIGAWKHGAGSGVSFTKTLQGEQYPFHQLDLVWSTTLNVILQAAVSVLRYWVWRVYFWLPNRVVQKLTR
jgi:hypothetical protein